MTTSARATQLGAEVHTEMYASGAGGSVRATQVGIEVLTEMYVSNAGGTMRATQLGIEVWIPSRRAGVLIPGL